MPEGAANTQVSTLCNVMASRGEPGPVRASGTTWQDVVASSGSSFRCLSGVALGVFEDVLGRVDAAGFSDRTVAFVFTDIQNSTAMAERDSLAFSEMQVLHDEIVRSLHAVLHSNGAQWVNALHINVLDVPVHCAELATWTPSCSAGRPPRS